MPPGTVTPPSTSSMVAKSASWTNNLDEEMAVYDDVYEEVFAEGLTFKPLPVHVAELDEEDSDDVGMFAYWH